LNYSFIYKTEMQVSGNGPDVIGRRQHNDERMST
jgi:hypothetical protein